MESSCLIVRDVEEEGLRCIAFEEEKKGAGGHRKGENGMVGRRES